MESIFVQIASYRDPECRRTVADLFRKARHPERIFVGICNQIDADNDKELCCGPYPCADQVREIVVPAAGSRGVCWARHQAQKLHGGEDYVLLIDSHMRFIDDWDERFIEELKLCSSPKAAFTNYPAAYTPPDRLDMTNNAIVMVAKPFNRLGDLRFRSRVLTRPVDKPLRGAFIAAGFLFATAALMAEVPHDPYMFFAQEEIAMSLRLYTHGWDVFSPRTNLIYHFYFGSGESNQRRLHWQDNESWLELAQRSRRRFAALVSAKIDHTGEDALVDIEKYSLGSVRTLKQFEDFTGIDFTARRVSQKSQEGIFIEGIEKYV
jgi:glycosyltransferase involved in cell wall biosynthesis